jgi:O-glycosyl hydrolase
VALLAAVVAVTGMATPAAADAPAVSAVRIGAAPLQTITGFGASGAWWPNDIAGFSPANQARIAALLFNRTSGLGLSIYRYNIGGGGVGVHPGPRAPKSFLTAPGTYNWNADPGGMAFLLQAYHYGVHRLIGFANSAPPFFTSNGADCGGSLNPASVGAYAAYLATVAAHLRTAYGIHLAAVSPMNEPTNDFSACNQEGMAIGPAKRANVITLLAQDLATRSPGTAVSADESTTSAALRSGIDRWIDPDVGSVAFHGYDYPTAAALRSVYAMVRARTSSQLEMSEVCCSTGTAFTQGYNPGILDGLWLANTMWRDLSAGEVSSFSWWTALSPKLGCRPGSSATCPAVSNTQGWNDGLLYYDPDFQSDGNQTIYFTRRYWVLGNFSRYIRPGAVHYKVTNVPAGIHVIAFLRNTWRFVLINDSATSRSLAVKLRPARSGRTYGQPTAYATTATSDLDPPAATPALDASTRTVTTTLPGRSVTTLIVPW